MFTAGLAAFAALHGCAPAPRSRAGVEKVILTFDPSVRYQTIEGWGGILNNAHWIDGGAGPKTPWPDELEQQMLAEVVNDLGLNRFRITLFPSLIEPVNDNADPFDLNPAGFDFSKVDPYTRELILPARDLLRQRGERFVFSVKAITHAPKGAGAPSLTRDHAEEYAEFAIAALTHFRRQGLEVDYWVIQNEPDLAASRGQPWSPGKLAHFAERLGARLRAEGFATRIGAPETVTPQSVSKWMGILAATPRVQQYLGLLTYHSYDFDPTAGDRPLREGRAQVAQWSRVLQLPVAQTEQSTAGRSNRHRWNGEDHRQSLDLAENLMADLLYADASAWELHSIFGDPNREPAPSRGPRAAPDEEQSEARNGSCFIFFGKDYQGLWKPVYYWTLRQFMRYVRPGAVRVGLTASVNSPVQAAGFLSAQDRPVMVLFNPTAATVEVAVIGLPGGEYHVSRSAAAGPGEELAPRRLPPGQLLSLSVPGESVVTVRAP